MFVVEPSASPFSSKTILVKKNVTIRLWIDYRKVNSKNKKDVHPMQRINDIFDTLTGSKYLTTLGLAIWHHKVKVHPDYSEKTAFLNTFWLFQSKRIPVILINATDTFIRLMTIFFSRILYNTCLAYLDDTIISGKTFDQYLERLDSVLLRLKDARLKLNQLNANSKKSLSVFLHI